ncbi:MAG TPA: serine/threonine-protein kinase, partial [Aggregatilineales bacterium]|nr:serine/threonine-protein kinase [Aggregatilineales bacterium]
MIGSKLGPYELIEEIGRGGMATVYRAYQPNVDRYVAVKVIHRSVALDSKSLERFTREAKLVARLEHPHILPVYDYDGLSDPPYIVMRYMPTGTLKDILERTQLPFHEVSLLVSQIGSALDYAHRQGVIHRDIKPTNIMVDSDGNAFLTDFGIARIVEGSTNLTGTGMAIGTPGYMAPEQGLGVPIDSRADIYALGVMTYEMLTGKLPYQAETPMAVILKHINDPVPDIVLDNPRLPAGMRTVIQRAMAKKPEDRFPTATEFSRALSAAIGPVDDATPHRLQAAAAQTIDDLAKAREDKRKEWDDLSAARTAQEKGPAPSRAGAGAPPTRPLLQTEPERSGEVPLPALGAPRRNTALLGGGLAIIVLVLLAGGIFAITSSNNNANSTSTAAQTVTYGGQTAIALALGQTSTAGTGTSAALANMQATTSAFKSPIPIIKVVTSMPTPTSTHVPPTFTAMSTQTATSIPPKPTATPSLTHSLVPTSSPTPSPTSTQTSMPSPTPTSTNTPTLKPTNAPSTTPSLT